MLFNQEKRITVDLLGEAPSPVNVPRIQEEVTQIWELVPDVGQCHELHEIYLNIKCRNVNPQ